MRVHGRPIRTPHLSRLVLVAALLVTPIPACDAAAASSTDASVADSLFHAAADRTDLRTVEGRQRAIAMLSSATSLDTTHAAAWFELGRLWLAGRYRERARDCFERSARLRPDDGATQRSLGGMWKYDWLATLDTTSLGLALRHDERAWAIAPGDVDAGAELVALWLVKGRPARAMEVARRLAAEAPARGEAWLALGAAAYRLAQVALADSAFEVARPRLSGDFSKRFGDESWFIGDASDSYGRTTAGRRAGTRAYWRENDPDLTTPQSEAELDFETRLAIALLLFREGARVRWDERTELFVRYGPPASIEFDPAGRSRQFVYGARSPHSYAPPPVPYHFLEQIWHYPELGMSFDLWDFGLTGTFRPAVEYEHDQPGPNPAALADHDELVAIQGGRGVFRALPPGTRAMPVRALVSRFSRVGGRTHLLAHVAVAGTPADSLVGSCAIATPDGRVLQSVSGALDVSACDPASEKVAEFPLDVPPGEYRLDLAVTDAKGRRGVARRAIAVPNDRGALTVSDLVVLCGAPMALGATRVRLEPNIARRIGPGSSLSAYFEVDHLRTGRDRQARFEYTYAVRPSGPKRARTEIEPISASREETFTGTLRRQFLTVPIATLPAGEYTLEVNVRDLVSGNEARAEVEFSRR